MKISTTFIAFIILVLTAACTSPDSERARTEKFLGVEVKELSTPQALGEFDDVGVSAPKFNVAAEFDHASEVDGDPIDDSRSSVYATAPDGTVWEAYCGEAGAAPVVPPEADFRADRLTRPTFVESYNGFVSTPENTRQEYELHHGYRYSPLDIFVGKREEGRLLTKLFFRDVGSHTTAPHFMTIDGSGDLHLVIADVNISENNNLDLYWVVGSPASGKWSDAWLLDHRGFTSEAEVWNGASRDKVHVIWSWDSGEEKSPGIGLFHVEKTDSGFSRKVRIVPRNVSHWSAAIDPTSGRILLAFSTQDGILMMSKKEDGVWTQPASIGQPGLRESHLQLEPGTNGNFVLKVNNYTTISTWLIHPDCKRNNLNPLSTDPFCTQELQTP
jgi:hypothetical protein